MKLKHSVIWFIVLTLVSISVALSIASTDIDDIRSCTNCGMDRKAYGYSRMLVLYKDGAKAGVCSLHCAVAELDANKEREVASLLVADRNTQTLIDVKKATWVIGGKKRGVMTQRAKWAFATQEAAQSFVNSYGGNISEWDSALRTARDNAK
jgi:nitrous oxide reductase accessory protein NosL